MPESTDSLQAKLNAETGKLSWKELERHFARGVVIWVAPDLDIVDVAARFVQDDRASVEQWLTDGRVGRPSSEQAEEWHRRQPGFWAVVAAPWVLVQELRNAEITLH
jgi:hypothetical protein